MQVRYTQKYMYVLFFLMLRLPPSSTLTATHCPYPTLFRSLLQFQFSGLIARFVKTNPAVAVHLKSVNRAVDVIAEGFDLAIRVRFPPLDDTGQIGRAHV